MTPKRALIFSLAYYPDLVGGAEVAVKEITDRIHPQEIEFHMITLRTRPEQPAVEKVGNVSVHRIGLGRQSKLSLAFDKHAYIILAPLRASHLHCRNKFNFTWGIMASYAGAAALFFKLFHMDVSFVLTLQEGDPLEYILNLKRVRPFVKIFRMIFTHADRIQAISKFLADFGTSMGAKSESLVIPNGVDTKNFSKEISQEKLDLVRREIGKELGDVFLVTASRLVAKNAVDDVISALLHLPSYVKFLILGSGELEANLKQQVKDLKLEDRVMFKGYVSHDDLPKYLKVSDIFIRPSLSEGLGNSFLEAMAAGIPVIATPVGGIVDFLKDKKTGLLCVAKDPKDIARKVEIYLHDTVLRDEIIENAHRMVLETYDWERVSEDMRDKVFDILKS